MKNLSNRERTQLAARAQTLWRTLPPMHRSASGSLNDESLAALSAACRRILRRDRTIGASLVLLHPSGQAETLVFGNARLHPQMPVTEKTCFRVASVSKLVMSFGALALCEQGMLNLDADIGDMLGYPVHNPHVPSKPVTLRMLLTHTAGLTDSGTYGTRGMESGCTLRELLEQPQNWYGSSPGERFQYSNLGAGAIGVLMERAANKPFDNLMQELVFSPLGIRASYAPQHIVPTSDIACGYSVRFGFPCLKYDAPKLASAPEAPFDPERDFLISAGRLLLDSAAMAQLLRLLASEDGMDILSRASLDEMRSLQDGKGGIHDAGRGLNTAFLPDVFPGLSPIGHQGVAYGMCSELFADQQTGMGVGVMTNGTRLVRAAPLMRTGFDLMALGFAALSCSE